MKAAYSGVPVTATEPVFGYMAAALGLDMRNMRFQLAIMNDTEPGASDVAAFENDLRNHRVRAFLYNNQTSGALAEKMKAIATESGVPVVGVSETEPPRTTYQGWMLAELSALDAALSGKQP
jgi:zinc/manganese transport system substrate-binding protein